MIQRPFRITLICIGGFVGALVALLGALGVLMNFAEKIGPWYPPYLFLSAVVGAACFAGLWKMKRWGLFVLVPFLFINQVMLYLIGSWHFPEFLFILAILAIGFSKINDMN